MKCTHHTSLHCYYFFIREIRVLIYQYNIYYCLIDRPSFMTVLSTQTKLKNTSSTTKTERDQSYIKQLPILFLHHHHDDVIWIQKSSLDFQLQIVQLARQSASDWCW